ncbi:MAG: hypothetical protein IPP82_01150 [Xanthomonadales bacterium]|nr:hypothetical protein [Xanthomonadales bacterium]
MASKTSKADKPGISLWRIIGAVLALVVLIAHLLIHANFVTGRSLLLAFPGWEVTYKRCWPNPFGGAWVSDVTLMPLEGDDEEVFHFDHLTVDVPMMQYYRSSFSRKRGAMLKSIKDISLEFSGGHGAMSIPFTTELMVFGNASASPFEAEGCAEDGAWKDSELAEMGLKAEPTELTMSWHRTDDRLIREHSIHTSGVGRVDYRGEELLHDDFPLFSLADTGLSELAASEWHVKDEGFAKARNAFCAKKDGITPSGFVDRHLDSVQRILAALGLEPTPSARSAYRQYVENGAPLDLVLNYSPMISGERYYDLDIGRWVAYMHGGFNVDGRAVGVGMKAIDVRPLPDDDDAASTWSMLESERAASTRRAQAASDAAPPTTATRNAQTPTIAVATSTPEAGEDLLLADEPEVIERAPVIEDYAKLSAEVGQRFMLYTKDKPAVRVEVVGVDEGVVKVRRYLRSGFIEQGVTRAAFVRAERTR